MDDNQILALYASGDDRAAAESEAQYGGLCARVARNILDNSHEADVCVHDALADARPPKDTKKLSIFLAKATRELALARFKAKLSAKRGDSHYQSTLDELNECVPRGAPDSEAGSTTTPRPHGWEHRSIGFSASNGLRYGIFSSAVTFTAIPSGRSPAASGSPREV